MGSCWRAFEGTDEKAGTRELIHLAGLEVRDVELFKRADSAEKMHDDYL